MAPHRRAAVSSDAVKVSGSYKIASRRSYEQSLHPALRSALAGQGIRVTGDAQERFRQALDAEARKYAALVKAAGIRAD